MTPARVVGLDAGPVPHGVGRVEAEEASRRAGNTYMYVCVCV